MEYSLRKSKIIYHILKTEHLLADRTSFDRQNIF